MKEQLKSNVAGLTERDIKDLKELNKFKGKKLINVIPFKRSVLEGFILQFEDNLFLVGQNNEYDCAFESLKLKEVKERLK